MRYPHKLQKISCHDILQYLFIDRMAHQLSLGPLPRHVLNTMQLLTHRARTKIHCKSLYLFSLWRLCKLKFALWQFTFLILVQNLFQTLYFLFHSNHTKNKNVLCHFMSKKLLWFFVVANFKTQFPPLLKELSEVAFFILLNSKKIHFWWTKFYPSELLAQIWHFIRVIIQ